MANISDRQVRAAISAIVAKEKRHPTLSPSRANERDRVWIRRNLRSHLEPIVSEMQLNPAGLKRLLSRHQLDVRRYRKKKEPEKKKLFAELARRYQTGSRNKSKAIKRLKGRPYLAAPLFIDKPASIFVYPSGMLVEDHIESGNSWVKLIWRDDHDVEGKDVSAKFFFAWQNPFDYLTVINVNADLAVRGQCTLSASPGLIFGGSSNLFLTTQLKVHMSGTAIGGHDQERKLTSFSVDTWGSLWGGDPASSTEDVFSTVNLAYNQIVVDAGQLVIVEVAMIADYWLDDGAVELIFARDPPYVSCPGVTIEILSAPAVVGANTTVGLDLDPG
jgi:hypothetical protein